MEQKINLILGSKVIRADGLSGTVDKLGNIDPEAETPDLAVLSFENGEVVMPDTINPNNYYLLNGKVLGNKVSVEVINEKIKAVKQQIKEGNDRIAEIQACLAELRFNADVLRKQKWRLEYQMNPELYKEQNPNKVKENSDDGNV